MYTITVFSQFTSKQINTIIPFFQDKTEKLTILEVGCGVGNFLFPLISDDMNIFFYACDFSPRAIAFVKVSKYVPVVWTNNTMQLVPNTIHKKVLG